MMRPTGNPFRYTQTYAPRLHQRFVSPVSGTINRKWLCPWEMEAQDANKRSN